MTAAERAREVSGPCVWTVDAPEVPEDRRDCITVGDAKRCRRCELYAKVLPVLLAHEDEVRRDEREACARLFEGTSGFLNWLCLDHGGEEAEKIAKMIRDSGREKEREG